MCLLRAAVFCGLRFASVNIASGTDELPLVCTPFNRTGTLRRRNSLGDRNFKPRRLAKGLNFYRYVRSVTLIANTDGLLNAGLFDWPARQLPEPPYLKLS